MNQRQTVAMYLVTAVVNETRTTSVELVYYNMCHP